jgi:hypothetical protein
MWRTVVSQSYVKTVAVDTSAYSHSGIPVPVTPCTPASGSTSEEAGSAYQRGWSNAHFHLKMIAIVVSLLKRFTIIDLYPAQS